MCGHRTQYMWSSCEKRKIAALWVVAPLSVPSRRTQHKRIWNGYGTACWTLCLRPSVPCAITSMTHFVSSVPAEKKKRSISPHEIMMRIYFLIWSACAIVHKNEIIKDLVCWTVCAVGPGTAIPLEKAENCSNLSCFLLMSGGGTRCMWNSLCLGERRRCPCKVRTTYHVSVGGAERFHAK